MTVTVYTKPSCGGCTATKAHLRKAGIPFTEEPLDDENLDAAIELGCSAAPVVCVEVDGVEDHWDGYRPDRIDALAGAA